MTKGLSRPWTSVLPVAVLAATLAACTPTAAGHPRHTSSVPTTPTGLGPCPTGWVCGTCPDGLDWRYLNDPQVLNNPPFGLDPQHPCT